MGLTGSVILIVLLVMLALAAAYIVGHFGLMLSGVAPEADHIASALVDGEREHQLLARWLRRSRWFRNVGGITGGLAGLLSLHGDYPPGTALTFGLVGMAAGSLLAEAHLLGPRPRSLRQPRTADLRPRAASDYWRPKSQLALIGIFLVAASLTVAEVIGDETIEVSPWWAAAATTVVAACWLCQWRAAIRRRPAMAEALRNADDLVRHLAITRGMADPAIMCSLVLLAKATHPGHPTVSAVLWFGAIRIFWTNRRLGLDWLIGNNSHDDHDAAVEARP